MNGRFESGCLNSTPGIDNSVGMNGFRPDPHVAQQSRREKLRVQQILAPTHHVQDLSNHLLHSPRESVVDPDPIQVRSIRNCSLLYDPDTMFSSEMLNFSSNTNVLLSHKDMVSHQELGGRLVASDVDPSFAAEPSSHPVSCSYSTSARTCDPQNPSYWKGLSSHNHGCDWVMNCMSGSVSNASPFFVGGIMSGTSTKEGNISSSSPYLKPGYVGFQNAPPSLNTQSSETSSQDANRQFGEVPFSSSSFYQNATFQEVVTPPSVGSQAFEMDSIVQQNVRGTGHGTWVDGGNESVLLPSYGNPVTSLRLNNVAAAATAWMDRPSESNQQWNSGECFMTNKTTEGELGTVANDNSIQGLSLSLSSHPPNELQLSQYGDKFGSQDLPSRTGIFHSSQGLKPNDLGHYCSFPKHSGSNKGYVNSVPAIVSSSMDTRRTVGPLGPFTGYATILKSSKFLRPAQQLLDEFCSVTGPKLSKTGETSDKCSMNVSASHDVVNVDNEVVGRGGNSGLSTCSFYSSTDACGEGGNGIETIQAYRPEFQRKKAKLLYMQEEVCKRYKQYHQQMQMVISLFESVAGLSAATPYTSLALKAVSKHFRCLKNAISDQLLNASKALGEEPMSAGTSKGEMTPRLKFIDHGFRKQKMGENLSFLEHHQQHIWRPQRGLPEQAVAILRAWLFEHFLHPYPTDNDKHMLASQTGLSRNQVSNWFINARVRVWKPMVEEIHLLETKGMDLNTVKNDRNVASDIGEKCSEIQTKHAIDVLSDKQSDCSTVGPLMNTDDRQNFEQRHHDKRTRVDEYQIPASMDGGLMSFVPYHSGIDIGGLGAVSLTLGLRHSAEGMQQQQQQQPLTRHLGGQMVHDFVG